MLSLEVYLLKLTKKISLQPCYQKRLNFNSELFMGSTPLFGNNVKKLKWIQIVAVIFWWGVGSYQQVLYKDFWHDNNLTTLWNRMKIKLNNVSKCYQISFIGLRIIMGQKPWYGPWGMIQHATSIYFHSLRHAWPTVTFIEVHRSGLRRRQDGLPEYGRQRLLQVHTIHQLPLAILD